MPESASSPPRGGWREWLPIASVLTVVAGAILTFGGYVNQVNDNSRRITALEAKVASFDGEMAKIDVNTTRTEAILQTLRDDHQGSVRP